MLFRKAYCSGEILANPNTTDLTIKVTMEEPVDDNKIHYLAASPPDYHFSFTGSGLPFANPQQAFSNTPNKGEIDIQGNSFTLDLMYPNSYYIGLGTILVPPSLSLYYTSSGNKRHVVVKVAEQVPFRFLSIPRTPEYTADNVMFYKGTDNLPVRTQEDILRDAGYPCKNKMPKNFWGLKPRC
jgi:hypothetical protein